jgi:hypothetical protein
VASQDRSEQAARHFLAQDNERFLRRKHLEDGMSQILKHRDRRIFVVLRVSAKAPLPFVLPTFVIVHGNRGLLTPHTSLKVSHSPADVQRCSSPLSTSIALKCRVSQSMRLMLRA